MRLFVSIFAILAIAAFETSAVRAAPSDVVAFVDVTVIPMNRNESRPHQTVLVEGSQIVAIGPSETVRVPNGARTVAGANRYLLPGLIDMHVHFRRLPADSDAAFSRFPDYRERNDDMGVLFVANGVTSVRQMHGHTVGDTLVARSRQDTVGTVDVGKRADLLLLEGNPLADLSNMKRISGVMVRGRWFPQSELQNQLEKIARAIATEP